MTSLSINNQALMTEIDSVEALTRSMIGCAEKSEWEQLGIYEDERQKKIKRIFASTIDEEISEAVAVAVTKIIADDQFIIERVNQYKSELFQSMDSLKSKKKATAAYTNVRDGDEA